MYKIRDFKNHDKFQAPNRDYYFIDQLSLFFILKFILRKILRLFLPKKYKFPFELAIVYQHIKIYHKRDLHGEGMTVGMDYTRVLNHLNIQPVENLFEFCAGPSYIGYNLLANEFCRHLTIADINPQAIDCANYTRKINKLDNKVDIYLSDVFDKIPQTNKFDLVIGNPVHFDEEYSSNEWRYNSNRNLIAGDANWEIHEKFYKNVKNYMKEGGLVIMQENSKGSNLDIFKEMISKNGGKLIKSIPGKSINGIKNGMYYIISEW